MNFQFISRKSPFSLPVFQDMARDGRNPILEPGAGLRPALSAGDMVTEPDKASLGFPGRTDRRTPGPASLLFNTSDIQTLLRDIAENITRQKDEFWDAVDSTGMTISLEQMILDRLTGKPSDNTAPLLKLFNMGRAEDSSSGISIMTFDLQIDFKGMTVWKGEAVTSEFHLELHLEQVSISVNSWSGANYDGLKQVDARTIDTGRYLIGFMDMTTLTIYDKHTKLSTTVWGDPHVDLSDVEGSSNGEFSDLTKSDMLTTFHLLDGTDVIITAPDRGAIEFVDIFKGDAHVRGAGLGLIHGIAAGLVNDLPDKYLAGGFFAGVDGDTGKRAVLKSESDVVNAGGDGNDWYDERGRLIWGSADRAEA